MSKNDSIIVPFKPTFGYSDDDSTTVPFKIHKFKFSNYKLNKLNKKVYKKMFGGVSSYMVPYHYPKRKQKKLKAGSTVPNTSKVKAPNGTHWVNKTKEVKHRVTDYENSDIFSDFDGCFNLKKVGHTFYAWVILKHAKLINWHGKPTTVVTHYSKPLVYRKWHDPDGKRSFALGSIAAQFAKKNIYEDKTQYPHVYHDVNMGVRSVKYWNIFDGGNNNSKPHIIAHKGENIIIDTGRMKVYKTDGEDLTKYTSFESAFPPLYGGEINDINFYPTVGKDCDVDVTYVPRIK